jgi:2-alkenal reductase
LQRGDIITKINGITLNQDHSYINTLFTFKPGDQVTLEVVRGNQTTQVQVTLGEAKQ